MYDTETMNFNVLMPYHRYGWEIVTLFLTSTGYVFDFRVIPTHLIEEQVSDEYRWEMALQ